MTPSDPIFPVALPDELDVNGVQAREVRGTATSTSTGHYRLVGYSDKLVDIHNDAEYPNTIHETFNRSLRLRPSRPLLGYRATVDRETGQLANQYTWWSTLEVERRRKNVGSGLMELAKRGTIDTAGKKGQWAFANWMVNRPEWQLTNYAGAAYSLITTSLYDTLGPGVVEYCLNHAQVRVVFASPVHIPELIRLAEKCQTMKAIVCVDNWDTIDYKLGGRAVGGLTKEQTLKGWGASKGVIVMDLAELEAIGEANPHEYIPPSPEDLHAIMYTSGTTGMPKGVLISHRNLTSASIGQLHGYRALSEGATFLSYLPLSHIFGQMAETVCLLSGVALGSSCGDMTRLIEDIQVLKPDTMIAVPRVLNRFYQVVKAATLDGPGLKGALSRRAFNSAFAALESAEPSLPGPLNIYDKLVFRKVRLAFGGNLKFMSSGSAPIAPEVLKFFTVALGRDAYLVEGYGQTEGMGTATRCVPGDLTAFGYIGPPIPSTEMKLVDVPDMGYLHTDKPYPRGEIWIRGPNVFAGYYKDEKNTKDTLTEDGWLQSGDIGIVDAKGRFKIIDRKKNLLKLSQGEYVALEKVDNIYALSPIVAQIYVHGDSLRDHLVAIVIPEPVAFGNFLRKIGKAPASSDPAALAESMKDQAVVDATLKELHTYHKGKLNGFEQIKRVHLSPSPFPEHIVTPTLKIKRQAAGKHYQSEIEKLYAQGVPESGKEKKQWSSKL